METLYTPAEVADKLKLKKNTIYDLIKRGELPSAKVGKQLRISSADLERYLSRSNPVRTQPALTCQQPHKEPASDENIWIISGQAPLLDTLCSMAGQPAEGYFWLRSYQNSYHSLQQLYLEKVQAAACCLWNEDSQAFDLSLLEHFLPGMAVSVVHLCKYRLGFYVPKGNPGRLHTVKDLASSSLVFANREKGSEPRRLLDTHLRREGLSAADVPGYANIFSSHQSVAAAVAAAAADTGIGDEASVLLYPELAFIPLETGSIDLVFRQESSILKETICSREFKNVLSLTAGYDTSETGRILI